MRIEIYIPVIDKALSELNRRFSEENMAILRAVGALTPGSEKFLDKDVLAPLANHYKVNIDDFNQEIIQMKRMIARKTLNGTMPPFDADKLLAFSTFISKYDDAFCELNTLTKIACRPTIPVTSVQSERSFSCLKLIKTHLRTTMLDARLSNLAILSMHFFQSQSIRFRCCC
jgi:hypothetical protein